MIANKNIQNQVEAEITSYSQSRLKPLIDEYGPYAIKFVQSKWAANYEQYAQLKISDIPPQTWGTATYVTPIAFPLSSALYGRIGLVSNFDPSDWRIFDATTASGRGAYISWARAQPIYGDLLLSVHSTQSNHYLRNHFRESFKIDCVLLNPDQEAELHTDPINHMWMAITDWSENGKIETKLSNRLRDARFTVLIDEDFQTLSENLPTRFSARQIESVTEQLYRRNPQQPLNVCDYRNNPQLPGMISNVYSSGGYLHVYIQP